MNPARVAYHMELVRRKRQLENELHQVNTALGVSETELIERMIDAETRQLRVGDNLLYMQREVVAHVKHGEDGNTDQAQRALRASKLETVLRSQIDGNKLKELGRQLLKKGACMPHPASNYIKIEEVIRLRFRDSEKG